MHRPHTTFLSEIILASLLAWLALPACNCAAQAKGTLFIDFLEKDSDKALACRVKILDPRGKEVRARGVLVENGWNLIEERFEFRGAPGDYTYQAFHGPQFSSASGGFTLDKNAAGEDVVTLPRHCDLTAEAWVGGDMLAFVPPEKTIRWLPAEDLQMAVVVAEQAIPPETTSALDASSGRWVEHNSYQDARTGSGGLVLHHWMPPAAVPQSLPSSRLLVMAKSTANQNSENQNAVASLPVHAEIQKLWARDVPIWLASGRVDSIQLLSSHLTYDGTRAERVDALQEPDGYFKGQRGAGRLVEKIYWHTLESGLRIPPSAGSGFGNTSSPLGYNRIYACPANRSGYRSAGGSLSLSSGSGESGSSSLRADTLDWWEAVRQGRSFVTNGPLLRVQVNGELPGHVFRMERGETLELDVSLRLTVADPVEYLAVIFNGQSLYQARLDEYAKQGGRIPPLSIKESGWLVVRVVTEREFTYRLATTAPYYFEVDEQPRISRSAVEFFQKWLSKSVSKINELDAPSQQAAQPYVAAAEKFWQERLEQSTAD